MKKILFTILILLYAGGVALPQELFERAGKDKIKVDFYETDIREVIDIIREMAQINIVVDKDVKGTVTLSLTRPVHWEAVLDKALEMNGLGKEYFGKKTVRIYKNKR